MLPKENSWSHPQATPWPNYTPWQLKGINPGEGGEAVWIEQINPLPSCLCYGKHRKQHHHVSVLHVLRHIFSFYTVPAPNKEEPFGFHKQLQHSQGLDTANACSHSECASEELVGRVGGWVLWGGPSLWGTTRKQQTVEGEGETPHLWRQWQKEQKGLVGHPIPTIITNTNSRIHL